MLQNKECLRGRILHSQNVQNPKKAPISSRGRLQWPRAKGSVLSECFPFVFLCVPARRPSPRWPPSDWSSRSRQTDRQTDRAWLHEAGAAWCTRRTGVSGERHCLRSSPPSGILLPVQFWEQPATRAQPPSSTDSGTMTVRGSGQERSDPCVNTHSKGGAIASWRTAHEWTALAAPKAVTDSSPPLLKHGGADDGGFTQTKQPSSAVGTRLAGFQCHNRCKRCNGK
jgi:hypothetical protein